MGLSVTVLMGEEILRPFRADDLPKQIPRALPWASQLCAIGAAERESTSPENRLIRPGHAQSTVNKWQRFSGSICRPPCVSIYLNGSPSEGSPLRK